MVIDSTCPGKTLKNERWDVVGWHRNSCEGEGRLCTAAKECVPVANIKVPRQSEGSKCVAGPMKLDGSGGRG